LENWISKFRKLKLDPFTKINSKWIKEFNIKPETVKLVQERAGNTSKLTGILNDFLHRIHMAHQQREKLTNWTTRN
jgi:coenzyme F420-reducing hydrogenase delta subunit